MPLKTLKRLIALQDLGASVIFLGKPKTVPGFSNYQKREQELKALTEKKINKIYSLKELEIPLINAGVIKEEMSKVGLKFIRRKHLGEKIYYLVNHTPDKIEGLIPLSVQAKEVLILDPLTGKKGKAFTQQDGKFTKVKLFLPSGTSIFLKTFDRVNSAKWKYYKRSKNSYKISGKWNFKIINGGPYNDYSKKINRITSWSQWDEKMATFSGTAQYEIKFNRPSKHRGPWLLKLGDVRESAKVWLNDQYLGILWSNPYQLTVDNLKNGKNTLRICVTNTGSNRIKAKEARGEDWKIFYNINMVGLDYQPFDASKLDILDAGLLKEPILIPLKNSE